MLCRTAIPGALALFATLLAPIGASAATITQSLSVDINPAVTLSFINDRVPSSSFNEFDPSLGTLNSVSFTLSGDIEWTGTESPPSLFTEGFLFAGVNSLVGGSFVICVTYGLCDVSNSGTDNFAPNFAFVTGTGSTHFDLELDTIDSGDQVSTIFDGDHPLTGTVTYDYTPNAVPEPLTISLCGAGLAGAVAMRRRTKSRRFS